MQDAIESARNPESRRDAARGNKSRAANEVATRLGTAARADGLRILPDRHLTGHAFPTWSILNHPIQDDAWMNES